MFWMIRMLILSYNGVKVKNIMDEIIIYLKLGMHLGNETFIECKHVNRLRKCFYNV